jgi:hypothetical protein
VESPAYVLEIICENVDADVRLNDWIAYRARDPRRRAAQVKLNAWLLEGDNELTVGLIPLDEELTFELRFYKTEHGTFSGDDQLLLYYRWTADESPLALDGTPTRVFSHRFTLESAFGPWSWEQSQSYMPNDRPLIEALVTAIHHALVERRAGDVVRLLSIKLDEMARSVGLDPAEHREQQHRVIAEQLSSPELRVGELELDKLQLRSSAGGRLVDVLDDNGDPAPLKLWVGDMPSHLGLAVSHVAGRWKVVR